MESFKGKGKTIASLTLEHNRLVKNGKPPQVKAVPVRGTNMGPSIIDQRLQEESKGLRSSSFDKISQQGLKIGGTDDFKWRCATCKFANEKEKSSCSRCHDLKNALKEPKIAIQKQLPSKNKV